MIDNGIFFSFASNEAYCRSLQSIRDKLCDWDVRGFYILKDRKNSAMKRYSVAIFDEENNSNIDVLLMGNTLYVLAMRLAEHKWFVTKKQNKEFGGCDGSIAKTLDFESGYGALGLTSYSGILLKREQCSVHTRAMKDFMTAGDNPSQEQIIACKYAFVYFAITIGEAVRFNSIESMMCRGGVNTVSVLPLLQRWVIDSSVRDETFPSIGIAVAGIHEKRGSVLFKTAYDELLTKVFHSPTAVDLAQGNEAVTHFLNKTGNFETISNKAWTVGHTVLIDAYFTDRLGGGALTSARTKFTELYRNASAKKQPGASHFNGIKF